MHYEDLAYATANGFAAVGTNNGHDGTTGVQFLNNDEVVTDFSFRAYALNFPSSETIS